MVTDLTPPPELTTENKNELREALDAVGTLGLEVAECKIALTHVWRELHGLRQSPTMPESHRDKLGELCRYIDTTTLIGK